MRILFGECIAGVGDGDRESLFVEARAVANVVGLIFTNREKQTVAFPENKLRTRDVRGARRTWR
jgi:hypothetical protein